MDIKKEIPQYILDSFDVKTIELIKKDFNDIMYENETKRTAIMIACMCGFFDIVKDLYNKYPNNLNNLDIFGYNIFTLSCCYNHTEISKWLLLNTEIDINNITLDGFTCLIYTCSNNNKEISNMILDRGYKNVNQKTLNGITALETISSKIMYEISHKILCISYDICNYDNKPFKIYEKEDFIEISYTEINHGTFGTILQVKTINGELLVMKKYKKKENKIINYSTISELFIIKKINNLEDITYKLYGIYIDENNDIYLVMEQLYYSLDIIYDKVCPYIYISYYKKLFYDILILINKMNMCGFIHNDLKHNNLMIDKYNKIKLIDFGFSEFLGIGPNSLLIDNYKATTFLKAPDINNEDKKNRKSYNSDIYAIGFLFLQAFFQKKMKKYSIIGEKLFMHSSNKNIKELNIKKLKNIDFLFDLIKNMISDKSYDRYTVIDCLNHDFFSYEKILYQIPNNITNLNFNIKLSQKNFITKYLANNYVKYTDKDILYNKYELYASNFIIKNYIKDNTIIFNYLLNLNLIDKLIIYLFELNYGIDTIFNILIFFRINNIENYDDSKIYIYIFGAIFESYINSFDNNKLINNMDINQLNINDFESKILLYLKNINNLNFYPIIIYIQFIIIHLQKNNINSNTIFIIETCLINYFFKFILFSNNLHSYKISDIIFIKFISILKQFRIEMDLLWLKDLITINDDFNFDIFFTFQNIDIFPNIKNVCGFI